MDQLEEFGLAVKAEPIEGERSNEQAKPWLFFLGMCHGDKMREFNGNLSNLTEKKAALYIVNHCDGICI